MWAMISERTGRPRLEHSRRPGKNARAEILEAAAERFTPTVTPTLQPEIASRRRPSTSLYHHFATKGRPSSRHCWPETVDEPRSWRPSSHRRRVRHRPLHTLVWPT